jgi:hypothetical protein
MTDVHLLSLFYASAPWRALNHIPGVLGDTLATVNKAGHSRLWRSVVLYSSCRTMIGTFKGTL